ncbi:hypothetical protein [Pontibacter sp. SGAir0037]|nr:hypothetical protein [Pontibacter sp. SGAir0037]
MALHIILRRNGKRNEWHAESYLEHSNAVEASNPRKQTKACS